MRKAEIVAGGVYLGKQGIRRVLDVGPQYRSCDKPNETDCLIFEVLDGVSPRYPDAWSDEGKPLYHATRASFAAWARTRIK